jgi:PleD family two-component response regulator
VAELAFLTSRGEPSHLTISAGVADFDMRRQPIAPDELIAAADKQLYLAKESGRNCVRSTES